MTATFSFQLRRCAPPVVMAIGLALLSTTSGVAGVVHRTANFEILASTADIAEAVGSQAEQSRTAIAKIWQDADLKPWGRPCTIDVRTGQGRPAGATTIRYLPQSASALRIEVSGPLDEVIESVLPHEVTHAVLASIFGRPLPRWIDEGLAILSEGQNAQQRQRLLLRDMLKRKPPRLRTLIASAEYPESPDHSRALYLVGFSLTEFLIGQHGRASVVKCLSSAVAADEEGWETAVRNHFKYDSLETLEQAWKVWLDETAPAVTWTRPLEKNSSQMATLSIASDNTARRNRA
ncbi:MAG: hypothetical protein HQ518_07345 [Rhodopirellula sp.]|nr:hypothetical protein [Rhodopirellula sp.]